MPLAASKGRTPRNLLIPTLPETDGRGEEEQVERGSPPLLLGEGLGVGAGRDVRPFDAAIDRKSIV